MLTRSVRLWWLRLLLFGLAKLNLKSLLLPSLVISAVVRTTLKSLITVINLLINATLGNAPIIRLTENLPSFLDTLRLDLTKNSGYKRPRINSEMVEYHEPTLST